MSCGIDGVSAMMNNLAETGAVDDEPLYNIGVVERMTGIPIATIRVWERRYGFPAPARTAGGHRLYSEQEVVRLRWVKARVDEGMQAAQAVKALRHLESQGQTPELQFAPAVPPRADDATLRGPAAHLVTETAFAVFQERLVAALRVHDLELADQVLRELLVLYPLEEVIFEVITPTLETIGQQWTEGQVSVATEHLATHYIRHHLLMWLNTGVRTHPVRPTVLACAPGELHEGSLLILGVMLRRQGWPVAYLGQSLPLPDLAAFVREIQPPAVVLVAMREETAQALTEWPQWLPEVAQTGRPPVTYGGLVFTEQPQWRGRVPGIFLGATLREGVQTLERLLRPALMR